MNVSEVNVFLNEFPAGVGVGAEVEAAVEAGVDTAALAGTTVGLKAAVAAREAVATGQSHVHDPQWWAGRDAVVVERLRAAGARILGHTLMSEHALGRPDPALGFPVPRNPWDMDRWTGGSSGGSAAGVAAGAFGLGIGTDTNGSIRIPAALCGVTGLKPTHAAVPLDGCLPLSPSLDVVGPLARTARACAEALAVMTGRTGELDHPDGGGRWKDRLAGARVGVPRRALKESAGCSEDCEEAFERALGQLRELGADIVDVELPEVYPLYAAQLVTLLTEGYALHADGLRERWAEYGRPFRRTIVLGGLIPDETRVLAERVRAWARDALTDRFQGLDAVATPTWPGTAPRLDDAQALQTVSWLPALWSAVGFPAIALPMGPGADGLPLSLQLAGLPDTDFALASLADVYQQHTAWHLNGPPRPREREADGPVPTPVPTPAPEPAAVVVPRSGGGSAETLQQVTVLLDGLGLGRSIAPDEIQELTGQWELMSMLFAFLAETPVGNTP
ncbi:amidase [Streptomyces sp. NPDC093510]|uniref:amidase n=1 Tax=Streptomyces sp. NPDC093510 TaxID=3155199 RepID=UPI003441C571